MPPRDMGGGVDAETRARRGGEWSRSAMRAGGAVAVRRPASDVDGGRGDYMSLTAPDATDPVQEARPPLRERGVGVGQARGASAHGDTRYFLLCSK